MFDWIWQNNGFIIEAALMAALILYIGLKIK
jgi:hypothetical protein